MASENDRQKEINDQLVARVKAKRKANRDHNTGKNGLGINSLMDMITIILVFLLKSYGEEPLVVLPNTDVPISTSLEDPTDMTVITINKEGIYLVRDKILELEDGKVAANFKKGGESGLIIEPLEAKLRTQAENLKNIAMTNGKPFEGDMAIIADQSISYRLLVEVMQTAMGTEFKKFRFAVLVFIVVPSINNIRNFQLFPGHSVLLSFSQ